MLERWREVAKETEGVGCVKILALDHRIPDKKVPVLNKLLDGVLDYAMRQYGVQHKRKHKKSYYYGFRTVWDNSMRNYEKPLMPLTVDENPQKFLVTFEKEVERTMNEALQDPNEGGDNFVTVASFDEWTENMMLLPNSVYGNRLLEIVLKVMQRVSK